ncbi:hypothetical protein JG731_02950 [Chlamydia gallinacea]|uniref:Uncharacterized protein n=1 Tax=Chlamydia gallinacea TaxID=1457153 RepID=A0ABS7ISP0_9CHLA|nr:hypothetical protein [Chlamydia gallinacea]AQT77187.1 hypothetical protein B1F83_00670 [Chlamydia gallinacea]MBX6680307.1 hypothetical protein [Chlamydia gallinacea]MBX6687571.1 hypothetical protein [Chlamydia gallinacea]
MSMISRQVICFNHHHTPKGYPVNSLERTSIIIIQNPLYRSCFEKALSYFPLFSTCTGIRAFLGLSAIKESLEIRIHGVGTRCPFYPCITINSDLVSIKRQAWLELLGIKGLFMIYHLVVKVVCFFLAYCRHILKCPRSKPIKSPQEKILDLIN